MALPKIVYLGLGANMGDRQANLDRAIERLECAELRVLRKSTVRETEPMYELRQARFLNQVVEAETTLLPRQLLSRIDKIERELGRVRAQANGPRTIDIDILLFGRAVVRAPGLEIPHPRMGERSFVLEPLAELAPDLRHPVTRRSIREMLAALRGSSKSPQPR